MDQHRRAAAEDLRNDVTRATTEHVVGLLGLSGGERRRAFLLIYERIKRGLEAYDARRPAPEPSVN